MIRSTWARVSSIVTPVSTTKVARLRFSASGIWRARIVSSFSGVIPDRSMTRARCTSAGALTTIVHVAAFVVSRLEQQRHFENRHGGAARPGSLQASAFGRVHQRMHDLAEALEALGIAQEGCRKFGSIDLAVGGRPWKLSLDGGDGFTFVQFVDQRIGIADGNTLFAKPRSNGRFAHTDRAGEADDEHCKRTPSGSRLWNISSQCGLHQCASTRADTRST